MDNDNAIIVGHTTKLNIVSFNGQPVLTFEMIDRAHGKAAGQAKLNFQRNKQRFQEGRHFFSVSSKQSKELDPYGVVVPPRGLTLITKRGYLLLVKSFTDDLAWEVQEQLVDHYFEGKQIAREPEPEFITDSQYNELIRDVNRICHGFHCKEKAQNWVLNTLRFAFNIGNVKELPAGSLGKAREILAASKASAVEVLSLRVELEEYIIKNYLCMGIPYTGNLRVKHKQEFDERLPRNPDWLEVASKLDMLPGYCVGSM